MTQTRIEPRSPRSLANTLPTSNWQNRKMTKKELWSLKLEKFTDISHSVFISVTISIKNFFFHSKKSLWWIWWNCMDETCHHTNKLMIFTNSISFSRLFHKHSQTLIYIYIYIYFFNANFIKHNRHFMSTYSLLDPFEFPYYFYRIRGELI